MTEIREIILKVHVDGNTERHIDVPVTPDTVCRDVFSLTQEPGDRSTHHLVLLWNGHEVLIGEDDNLYEVLQHWDQYEEEIKFVLRPGPAFDSSHPTQQYREGQDFDGRRRQRNEMRNTGIPAQNGLPGGVDLTLSELQEMAARQQQQIEHQQQVLVAKEQRLKYLKQQEQRHQQIAAENDRLRKLREKVETQEMKLKKLRALRGEAEKYKNNNGGLNSELESVKALFSEKEKELVMAVAKVEELTKQLEDIQKEKSKVKNGDNQSAAAFELEKLKKELLLRNKLNDQQNTKLNTHREMLNQRKDEISKMDNRIQELQQRLKKKRAEQQKNVANQAPVNKGGNRALRSNVAAVEPYIQHVPNDNTNNNSKFAFDKQNPNYQSLPVNAIKFSLEKAMEESKAKGREQSKEQNNNVKKPDIHAIVRTHPPQENGSVSISSEQNSSQKPPQQLQQKPPSVVSQNKQKQTSKPPPPLPVRSGTTGLTYLTPRPFGSTYSTSAISRGQNNQEPQTVPSINVAEDVRTGGSGQSSPASSEGSQKEAPLNSGLIPQSSGKQNNITGNNQTSSVQNSVNKTVRQRPPSSKPNLSAPHHPLPHTTGANSQVNPPSVRPSCDQTDSSKSTKHPTDTKSAVPNNLEGNSASPILSQGNQQNVNGSDSSLNSDSSSTGGKQPPTYRYASKNVIANTYMGRLGPEALKKYQQNVNLMYTNLNKNVDNIKTGENNSENTSSSKQQQPSSNQSLTPPTNASNSVPHPTSPPRGSKPGLAASGSSNHPDIASDKMSHNHNRHTPKNLRRRHSDSSDNEDVAKLLLKYVDRYNQNASNQEKLNGESRVMERYDTKATSFKDQIPETVQVDSMGNLMDDNNISPDNSAEQNGISGSSEDSSPASVQLSPSDKPVLRKKTNLKMRNAPKSGNRVSFDPLALLLDASLEGELPLVMRCAGKVENVSEPNDEGITALHNAICAGHYEIVKFLVEFGCDVNSPDSDGWTPLHCAASCNNLPMVKFLVEHGACIFATTISDQETAAEKCEEDEDGFDGCSEYLYSVQEKLGIMNNGKVWAVFDYDGLESDELSFKIGDDIKVLKKGDEKEKEWWWSELNKKEGYIPRNLLGLYPRVLQKETDVDS